MPGQLLLFQNIFHALLIFNKSKAYKHHSLCNIYAMWGHFPCKTDYKIKSDTSSFTNTGNSGEMAYLAQRSITKK